MIAPFLASVLLSVCTDGFSLLAPLSTVVPGGQRIVSTLSMAQSGTTTAPEGGLKRAPVVVDPG
jgi:hypothetical protein